MGLRSLLILALLAALAAAPAARAQEGVLEQAASALEQDLVFVHPDADPGLTPAEANALRDRITERDAGPMYIAVLPARAASEAGGSVDAALSELQSEVGRRGTYAIVAGRRFRAGSTGDVPEGATAKAADAALKAKRDAGLAPILLDFVDRMGEVRAGGGDDGAGGGGGPGSAG